MSNKMFLVFDDNFKFLIIIGFKEKIFILSYDIVELR